MGFKAVWEPVHLDCHNNNVKWNSLILQFLNFYWQNQKSIVIDYSMHKIFNPIDLRQEVEGRYVRSNFAIAIGDDDYCQVMQDAKEHLWKLKVYSDLTLICSDKVEIEAHRSIITQLPLFRRFDDGIDCIDTHHYIVDFKSKPMDIFLEIVYTGKVEFKGVNLEVLFDLYHICHMNEFKTFSQKISRHLFSIMDETNCSEMLDFYLTSGLEDEKFLLKVKEDMKK